MKLSENFLSHFSKVMGCQRKTAEQIHQQGADYVLAVKENQGKLY